MQIWKVSSATKFEYDQLSLIRMDDDLPKLKIFKGKSLSNIWTSIELYRYKKKKKCDAPNLFSGLLALTQSSIDKLDDLIGSSVEYLPVTCADRYKDLKLVNVLNVLDALDYDKILYRENNVTIEKYPFIEEKVKGQHIFKVYEDQTHSEASVSLRIFVSEEFKNRVLELGLKGFSFGKIWDSESELINSFYGYEEVDV